jgi:hypothetical protein
VTTTNPLAEAPTACRTLRRERLLPVAGEVLVVAGQAVGPDTVIAEAARPGPVKSVPVARLLDLDAAEVASVLLKSVGAAVEKDEVIARRQGAWGFGRKECRAPEAGILQSVSAVTGQVLIVTAPAPVRLQAAVAGRVERIVPNRGAVIITTGIHLPGVFGIGADCWGPLAVLAQEPDDVLTGGSFAADLRGRVVVAGSGVTLSGLRAAAAVQAAAVVTGGLEDRDLRDFLGYEIGVAVTGAETAGLTVVVTEGFGPLPLDVATFAALQTHQGKVVSVRGATQIRAGVIRPDVVIPLPGQALGSERPVAVSRLREGTRVRVSGAPYEAARGRIVELPPVPQAIATEACLRVARVELADGSRILVPRANLEPIE